MRDRSKRYGGLPLGVCATAASTVAKVLTMDGFIPEIGDMFAVTFTSGNTVSTMTLNINNKGAKRIRLNNENSNTTTASLNAGATILLIFDGTFYQMVGSQRTTDTDTNFYPTTFTWTGGTTSGPTGSLTGSGMSAVTYDAIPAASVSASGIVTTGIQTFLGTKTFREHASYDGVSVRGRPPGGGTNGYTITVTVPNTALADNRTVTLPDANGTLALTSDVNAIKPLRFSNTAVLTSAWVADTTYTGYGFRASVTLSGALSTMIPDVVFAPADADTGNFCSVSDSYTGGVYLYAKAVPAATITIPHIKLEVV